MTKETKEQKQARRKAMGLNNPKKDWWAKRNNRTKNIGGVPISPALLREAQKRRIEYMMKEAITGHGKVSLWQKIKNFLIKLWQKLFRKTTQK